MTSTFADVLGLANRPGVADCVKWSDDGVLAVAAAHSVVLLNPGDLLGPRAFASPGNQCDVSVLQAPGAPADPTADAHHELVNLRQGAMVSQYPLLQLSLQVRALAWSPAGCASSAGCLLATVTNDHQVLVYGAPSGPRSEWQQVADLSQHLLQHLEDTGWQDLDPQRQHQQQEAGADATAAAAADGGILRLRGGAKRKRPAERMHENIVEEAPMYRPDNAFSAAVGQDVEVMTSEEGLEGCWFYGTVQALEHGWALVAYNEMQELKQEGSGKLREWFPLPGQRQGPVPRQPASSSGQQLRAHSTALGPQLRPVPPAERSDVGAARCVGDVCDALIADGWWEGCCVVELQEGGAKLLLESGGERHVVERAHTRRCLLYRAGQWEILVAAAHAGAPEASPAGGKAKGGARRQSGRRPARSNKQDQEEPAEAAVHPAAVPPAAELASEAAAAAVAVAAAMAAEEPPDKKQRQRLGCGKKAAAGSDAKPSPGEQQQEQGAAGRASEEAIRPQQQQGRVLRRGCTLQQLAAVAAARDGTSPVDMAAAAAAAAAAGGTAGSHPPAATAKVKKKAAGGGGGSKRAAPDVYEVPADFDPSVLAPVDLTSIKAARASLPLAFCRRFLGLRRLVPEAELPTYKATSSHLKGVDAQLVAQAVAELMHAHSAKLAALGGGLTAQWLNTDGRQRLRFCWDRTRNKVLGRFKVVEEDRSEPSSESEGEERRRSGGVGGEGDGGATETEDELVDSGGGRRRQRGTCRRRSSTAGGSQPALDFPPHPLPEGFSWRDLPGVDPSNEGSAKSSLVLAAARRFLTLHKEYDGEKLPQYEMSSSHLRGRDAWLVERVTREFTFAYAQLLADLKWNAKAFQTCWLSRLRAKWDRITNRVADGFSLEPDEVDPGVLLAVGDPEAAEAAAWRGPRLQNRPSAKKPARTPSRPLSAGGSSRVGLSRGLESGDGGSRRGSDLEGDTTTVQHRQKSKKKKEGSGATVVQRIRSSSNFGSVLSSHAYQLRLLGASSLSCAWSPVVAVVGGSASGGSGGRQQQLHEDAEAAVGVQCCCFLAVGAKAGRVWLWRYRLPRQYSLLPPQGEAGGSFELVGCLAGSPGAWVSSLAWRLLLGSDGSPSGASACTSGNLVLAVGCSDGSVLLYGAETHQLTSLPGRHMEQQEQQQGGGEAGQKPCSLLPAGMQRWGMPCQPDLLGVTSLAVQLLSASSGGGSHLLVAAGKSAGSLAVWRSGLLRGSSGSTEQARALGSGAAGVVAHSVQGTRAVTGLAWLPSQQQGKQADPGQPLLLSCTHDGAAVCRQLAEAPGGGLALLAVDGTPQAVSGRRRKKELGHCALGLAASPGGLFLSVVCLSLSPAAEIIQSLQIHERVIQGLVQLDRLAGPDAPLEPLAALSTALEMLVQPPGSSSHQLGMGLAASSAWEVAMLLRLLAKWQPAPAGGQAAAADNSVATALIPPLAPMVLQQLEQPLLELQQLEQPLLELQQLEQPLLELQQLEQPLLELQQAAGDEVLSRVAPHMWRSLQLATALRHLLDPARLVREQHLRAKKEVKVVSGSVAVPARMQPFQSQWQESQPAQQQQQQQQPTVVKAEEEEQQHHEEAGPVKEAPPAPALPMPSQEQVAQHGAFALLMVAPPSHPAALPSRQAPPALPRQQQQPQRRQKVVMPGGEAARQDNVQLRQGEVQAVRARQVALLEQWQQATERNEMLLLQRHMRATLAVLLPESEEEGTAVDGAGVAGGDGGGHLSQLLMADWITLNVQHPLLLPEMLPLAGSVYMNADEEIPDPDSGMLARETSTLFDAPVAMTGAGVAAATTACIGAAGGGAQLARCPASLLLCESRPYWACRACGRKYRQPAGAGTAGSGINGGGAAANASSAPPACIFCGLPLGPTGPAVLFNPPCCS